MLEEYEAVFARIEAKFRAKSIPKLKTLYKGAINNLSNLMNILIRKSFLKENKYQYSEEEANKFYLPEEKQFLDNEKPRVIYDRIKSLINAMDYLANNVNKEVEEFSQSFLENSYKALSYFSFQNINSPGVGVNTKAIKDMTDKILGSNDQILRRVIIDNLKLLSDNYKKIRATLDSFVIYNKEKYKAKIRFKVFPFLPDEFTENLLQENPSAFLKKLQKYMFINTPDIQFNKFWIAEAVKNCFSTKEENDLERIKKMFVIDNQTVQSGKILYSPREKLISIIDFIAHTNISLEKLYFRLDQNLKLLSARKKNFLEQIVDIFKKAVQTTNEDEFFQLEYINPSDKAIKNDTININDFMLAIKKKIVLFKNLLKDGSTAHEKVKRGTEEALYKFVEETYFDLLLTKERIIGINGEIRLRLHKKERMRIKEFSDPLEALDESLTKIADMRRKYVLEQEKSFQSKHNNHHE